MKTIQKTIYRFSELSEDAKVTAIDNAQNSRGYAWEAETLESIKALAAAFHGKIKDYGIDWFNNSPSYMYFDMPEMEQEDIESILSTLGSYWHGLKAERKMERCAVLGKDYLFNTDWQRSRRTRLCHIAVSL